MHRKRMLVHWLAILFVSKTLENHNLYTILNHTYHGTLLTSNAKIAEQPSRAGIKCCPTQSGKVP